MHRKTVTTIPHTADNYKTLQLNPMKPQSLSNLKAGMNTSYISSQNQNNSTGFLTQNDINI